MNSTSPTINESPNVKLQFLASGGFELTIFEVLTQVNLVPHAGQ